MSHRGPRIPVQGGEYVKIKPACARYSPRVSRPHEVGLGSRRRSRRSHTYARKVERSRNRLDREDCRMLLARSTGRRRPARCVSAIILASRRQSEMRRRRLPHPRHFQQRQRPARPGGQTKLRCEYARRARSEISAEITTAATSMQLPFRSDTIARDSANTSRTYCINFSFGHSIFLERRGTS
jgi:hypothetical protein